MDHNCANCNQLISENFCSSCGQKKFKRINRKYILDEVQYTVLHTNKGFLYSLKKLIRNPGKTAKEFIDGNRVNHYKPILLTFVLSSLSALISYKIIGMNDITREYYSRQHMNSPFMNDLMTVIVNYNSAVTLLLVPFFAFITKLAFRKWGHNYYEHAIMNCYILSFYTVICIAIVYPLMYIYRAPVDVPVNISSASILTIPFILVWFYKELYNEKPWKSIIWRTFVTLCLVLLACLILFFIIIIGVFIIAHVKGPEALKYLQPG